jgi:hypothetical protein
MMPLVIVLALLTCIGACIVYAAIAARRYAPPIDRRAAAHKRVLFYLGRLMDASADRAPDPALVRQQLAAILEWLDYPARGKISDWEKRVCTILYVNDEEPVEPWHKAIDSLFEFASVNLYAGFSQQRTAKAYEQVSCDLVVLGISAMSFDEALIAAGCSGNVNIT